MASIGVRPPTTCPPYLYYWEMTSVISGPYRARNGQPDQKTKNRSKRSGIKCDHIFVITYSLIHPLLPEQNPPARLPERRSYHQKIQYSSGGCEPPPPAFPRSSFP